MPKGYQEDTNPEEGGRSPGKVLGGAHHCPASDRFQDIGQAADSLGAPSSITPITGLGELQKTSLFRTGGSKVPVQEGESVRVGDAPLKKPEKKEKGESRRITAVLYPPVLRTEIGILWWVKKLETFHQF